MSDQDDISLPPLQDDNTQPQATSGQALPVSPSNPTNSDQSNVSPSLTSIPQEAADLDLIEKQWVVKAKEIVEHTNEDPHLQQQEIAKMKAEYIKKRYKRDIQL